MKILIEINHPGHVHLFRHVIDELTQRNHSVRIIAREKDVATQLLKDYKMDFVCISHQGKGIVSLFFEMLQRDLRLLPIARKFQPDIFLSVGGMCSAQVSALMNRISIVMDDSEHARLGRMAYLPFTTLVCTPDCYPLDLGAKQMRYAGFHELAYLHPSRFKPDPTVRSEIGLSKNEPFFILRFVSWAASHDIGQIGFSNKGKQTLVHELKKLGRVIITSESVISHEFEPYCLKISPTRIHDLLNYSSLYIGEGATMASEAAMLGVPSIYVNSISCATIDEQEQKYGLVHHIVEEEKAIDFAISQAKQKDVRSEYQEKRRRLLEDKIDVTAWMLKLIEGLQ